jgi:REP element-mobilizing transposase RayT
MARPLRRELAGGLHHVYARGNDGCHVYRDDLDRTRYLRLLGTVVAHRGWRCLAYCLMTTHVHLLVETPEPNLAVGMHQLHGEFVRAFNKRHGRSGHLFQGRYGSVLVRDDAQLWTTVAYIAANPVEAGICGSAADWRWSSHGAVVGEAVPPPWLDVERLLGHFGGGGGDPRERYARHVADRRAA